MKKLRIRFSGDLLLIVSFCLIACCSLYHTYSGQRAEPEGIRVNAETVMMSGNEVIEVSAIAHVEHAETDDIQYAVRNADGTPSTTMRVVNGFLQADEPGTGYLYVYVNGEASRNGIPVHVYETPEEKETAVLVHQELKAHEQQEPQSAGESGTVVMTSSEEPVPMAHDPLQGHAVVFQNTPAVAPLAVTHVSGYYTSAPALVPVDLLKDAASDQPVILAEVNHITAWLGQKGNILPRIWSITPEGARSLTDAAGMSWESSDPSVITVENGVPAAAGTGEAKLTGTLDTYIVELQVEVTEPDEVSNFTTASKEPYTLGFSEDNTSYTAGKTYSWPTVLPKETGKPVTVKGNRIYQCGSQYYYAEEDFTVDWSEDLLCNAEAYSDHLICLSQGLVCMEGDNLSGIVPGVVFRHHDSFWVSSGDAAAEPMESDAGWIEISDLFEEGEDGYDPGADTGPESDALSYPDAQYNPYPGSISSNCTYAVWALANQALGVRLPNWGDAGNWFRRAGISGYPTGQKPAAYSIVVWDHHVGFVTAVSEDGTMMYVKEGNSDGRYREGWWPVAAGRHGQKLYGFIYLTNDHGDAIKADTVEVTAGFNDTEEEFLKVLKELGLEPGERTEEYSDEVEEGYIISYTTGELAVGSVVDYIVSLGPEPEIIIDEDVQKKLAGMTKDELLAWFEEQGLTAGKETVEESEEKDGTVLRVAKGTYSKGDEVDYTISKQKAAETPEPTEEPTAEPTAEPEASAEPDPTAEPQASEKPEETPLPSEEPDPTAEPTAEPELSAEPDPTAEPEPSEQPEETPLPSAEPDPTVEPTAEPEASAEPEPTAEPTPAPTPEETVLPTVEPEPTAEPTPEPVITAEPEPEPTPEETVLPTEVPELPPEPTAAPAEEPAPAEETPEPAETPVSEPSPEPAAEAGVQEGES